MALPGMKKKKNIGLGLPVKEGRENRRTNWFPYLVILVIIIGNIIVFIKFNEQGAAGKNDNVSVTQDILKNEEDKLTQAQKVVASFSKVYAIPPDDDPSVIAITDADKLRQQDPKFYENAKNGDKVLILYSKKLAFIFREEESKIINVGFISTDSQSQ